jgi:diguanylate cyclase (GGDEF)-like protein/hemerythrin-like metal-binding protein/PAS domain S-box-containing protein
MCSHHPETKHLLLPILWDESLATGIPDVDSQHQTLFDLADQLRALHSSSATAEEVDNLLKELEHYTVYHFQTEELLMRRYSVSDSHRKAHIFAHQDFIHNVKRAGKLAPVDPNAAVDFLLALLSQWFLNHIANMDMLLVNEVNAVLQGLTPDQVVSRHLQYQQTLIENVNNCYSDLGDRTLQTMELNLQLLSEIERRKEAERELSESQELFRMMADHTHCWEYWIRPDGNFNYISPSCLRITGYTPEEFRADRELLSRIIHPDDQHLIDGRITSTPISDQGDDELGFRIIHKGGDIRWIVHSFINLYGPSGDFLGRRCSNRDITERQLQNDSMLLLANVFESINEAALVTDENNRIIVVNSSFSNITGYTPEDIIGKSPGMLPDKVLSPLEITDQMFKLTEKGRWQGEIDFRRKNGELYTASVSINCMRDSGGSVSNFIIVFSDISDRKESEQRIQYLAHHDLLTGLPNWTLFSERIKEASHTAKHKRSSFALLFVDIDRFKQTKDWFGHEFADLLLKKFADRIRSCLRDSDTPARIGSDEFVVLLPDSDSKQRAEFVANQILKAITEPFLFDNHSVNISASIGIALFPEHGTNVNQLVKYADLAVFHAKRTGGGVAYVYNPSDHQISP